MASDEKIYANASNAASKAPRSVPDNIDELWDALMDKIPESRKHFGDASQIVSGTATAQCS